MTRAQRQRRAALRLLAGAIADEPGTLSVRLFEMPARSGPRLVSKFVAEHPSGRYRISVMETTDGGWHWERHERPGDAWKKIEGWTP